jgi:hypothetical protein
MAGRIGQKLLSIATAAEQHHALAGVGRRFLSKDGPLGSKPNYLKKSRL